MNNDMTIEAQAVADAEAYIVKSQKYLNESSSYVPLAEVQLGSAPADRDLLQEVAELRAIVDKMQHRRRPLIPLDLEPWDLVRYMGVAWVFLLLVFWTIEQIQRLT